MNRRHPVYGSLVVSDFRIQHGRWLIRNSPVALDDVLDMINDGFSTEDILQRHILLLRSDLVEITLLHAMVGR